MRRISGDLRRAGSLTLSIGLRVVAGQPVLGADVDRAHAAGDVPGGLDVAVGALVAQVAAGELPPLLDGDGVLDRGDRAVVTTATCTSARKASRSAGVIARDMIHRLALPQCGVTRERSRSPIMTRATN